MRKSIYSKEQERLQNLIREIRLEAGLTQEQLAKCLGKPQSFISKYESGERRLDVIEIGEICKTLGISLLQFVKRFERSLK